jgi:four helix bundle protein
LCNWGGARTDLRAMQRFTELLVWQRSHAFVLRVYKLSSLFPPDERDGVTSQLRRAAVSVATNVVEGAKRRTRPDYARFLNYSEASMAEVEYLLLLCRDLGYLPPGEFERLSRESNEIERMLFGLRQRVQPRRR